MKEIFHKTPYIFSKFGKRLMSCFIVKHVLDGKECKKYFTDTEYYRIKLVHNH